MSTPRELFHQIMRFECPGRTLLTLGGIWPSCFDRWAGEGMPADLRSIPDLLRFFDLTPHTWCGPRARYFLHPLCRRRVLAQTADKITYVNSYGITCTEFRRNGYMSMPHFEAFPVRGRDDWRRFRRRLAWHPARVGADWRAQAAAARASDLPVIIALNRGASLFGSLRELMGLETLATTFYDDPALIVEMMDAMVALSTHLTDALFADYTPDAVCLWEDMAGKNGSLISPRLVRELMLPRYRVMVARLRAHGIPHIFLDSDGDIRQLIPLWLEAGIDGVVPLEAQAGMDVAAYRKRYPRLLMMGGVDKKALAAGPAGIDAEIAKIRRTIASGGYIPFFDHGLPHDVSWASFCYFVTRLRELAPRR